MFESLRPCLRWCGIGFLAAATLGAAIVGLTNGGWVHGLLFAPALGMIGAAFGFILATFYYAMRETGWRPMGRRALGGALSAVVIALVLHQFEASLAGNLLADLTLGPLLLGFTAAYFHAVEFWIRRGHDRFVQANGGIGN